MILLYGLFIVLAAAAAIRWLSLLFDGQPLQPTAREILIRRCDEQHAAIMAGDEHLGTYGKYPPSKRDLT